MLGEVVPGPAVEPAQRGDDQIGGPDQPDHEQELTDVGSRNPRLREQRQGECSLAAEDSVDGDPEDERRGQFGEPCEHAGHTADDKLEVVPRGVLGEQRRYRVPLGPRKLRQQVVVLPRCPVSPGHTDWRVRKEKSVWDRQPPIAFVGYSNMIILAKSGCITII